MQLEMGSAPAPGAPNRRPRRLGWACDDSRNGAGLERATVSREGAVNSGRGRPRSPQSRCIEPTATDPFVTPAALTELTQHHKITWQYVQTLRGEKRLLWSVDENQVRQSGNESPGPPGRWVVFGPLARPVYR